MQLPTLPLPIPIPTEILLLIIIVIIIVVVVKRRPSGAVKTPIIKQIVKMRSSVEKGRQIPEMEIEPRQEIITRLFKSKMDAIGLEPSTDSGIIPVTHTPLAAFLIEHGLDTDTVSTILIELKEITSKTEVEDIIEAAAEIPGVTLKDEDIEMAKDLAIAEWMKARQQE